MHSGADDDRGAEDATPLNLLVGRNARRIRRDTRLTQAHIAEALTQLGLRWSPTRYAQLEAGEVTITIPVLVLLAAAFDTLSRTDTQVADLLHGDSGEMVELTAHCSAPAAEVVKVLTARIPANELGQYVVVPEQEPTPTRAGDGYIHADWRVARQLGLRKAEMLTLSRELWGHSLSQERDRRLGDRPTALVERSRVTAELREQLQGEVERRRRRDPHFAGAPEEPVTRRL